MLSDPAIDRADLFALKKGDDRALNRLMARWERPLFGFAFRYVHHAVDAQDLVAEAFVRLYQQRLRLKPETNLAAWLFTILGNRCHNHNRWKRRHATIALETGEAGPADLASPQPAPDAALQQAEAARSVREAVEALPHDLKVALLLHHYEKLSYREIAEIAGCSERGVETRLYRARQQLRQALAGRL